MASRKTGSCSQCGGGHGNGRGSGGKSKFWYWVAGIAAVWLLVHGTASNDGGHSDYRSPSEQSQTTQKKCDPNALLQLGCTP